MSDIALVWDNRLGIADIALAGPDLSRDDGLHSAVLLSLFTDARAATDDDLPAGDGDRRGWWGDTLSTDPADHVGSRLWLLDREKRLPGVLARVEAYASEALAWLLTDGVAQRVTCSAAFVGADTVGLSVEIERPDGRHFQKQFRHRFDSAWEAMTQ